MDKMKELDIEKQESQYKLSEQVAKIARTIKPRRYISQPMPGKYSKTFQIAYDHPVPSQMQEAFARTIA